ncbi:MAG: hypothetical protein WAT14_01495 [Chitinophagaceae bacterium]
MACFSVENLKDEGWFKGGQERKNSRLFFFYIKDAILRGAIQNKL